MSTLKTILLSIILCAFGSIRAEYVPFMCIVSVVIL